MKSIYHRLALRPAGVAVSLAVIVSHAIPARAGDQPLWVFNPLAWTVEAEQFQAGGPAGFAVRRDVPRCMQMTVEAEVRIERSVGPRWKVAGIAVFDDRENFWHLALVEAPDDEGAKRFIELSQMRAGQWLSHTNLHCSRRQMVRPWQPGQTYRLALSLDAKGIEGRVTDADGNVAGDVRFEFTAEAVAAGRPALRCEGFVATLDGIRVQCAEPLPDAPAEFPAYASDSFVAGVRGEATGFFRVEKQDGRWWAIDPLGRGCIVLGVDHVSYNGHWCQALNTHPYRDRNDAAYAGREPWAAETAERLKNWGFNMLGAGHGAEMVHRGLAHSQFVGVDAMAWSADDDLNITPHEGRPCSAFPNVFHPKFEDYCRYRVERRCRPWVGDPWLFGYYLDNELAWWGRGDVDTGLFDAAMAKPAGHSAKQALRDFLAERYEGEIERFRDAWGITIESFDAIVARDSLAGANAETVHTDKREFLRLIADRYFGILAREIRRADPDHLILGCRFAGGHVSDVVWETAAKHCDVVSINYYGNVDLDRMTALDHDHDAGGDPLAVPFEKFHALATGRPLLLTEWSFIGLDSGLPCTEGAGQRFHTQSERSQAAAVYAETLLRMPWMLGYNYFMWVDEPAEGITEAFPENSNYGLVNVDNQPYAKLTETFIRVHHDAERFRMEGLAGLPEPAPRRVPAWQDIVQSRLDSRKDKAADRRQLQFTSDDDGHLAANGRLTLRVRAGSPNLADEVLLDGNMLGHLHGLVHHVTSHTDRWARPERLQTVEGRVEEDWLILDMLGRSDVENLGSPMRSFTLKSRIVLPAGADWMIVEFVELTNTDDRPLDLRGVFFQPRSSLGGSGEGDRPASVGGVPRLWTSAPGDAWIDDRARLFWGAVAPRGSGVAVRFWLNPQGGQHPDIR
ncbi:MAG: hypothetical protein RBS80_24535, partial [Thermoguttaceae bacterium]|nr:hypothetical protein [Thermoguttaceae bacterium]